MPYPSNQSKLDHWCSDVKNSYTKQPGAWNVYDSSLRDALATYTAHLGAIAGYVEPEFAMIKGMLWTETGPGSPAWKTAPMQIGVNGDPGLGDLLDTTHGNMILPPTYKLLLNHNNVPVVPDLNIKAGVGYLLKLLAMFHPVVDTPPIRAVSVAAPKSHRKVHHAVKKTHLTITGWRTLDVAFAAKHYNVGDGNYKGKPQFCRDLILSSGE